MIGGYTFNGTVLWLANYYHKDNDNTLGRWVSLRTGQDNNFLNNEYSHIMNIPHIKGEPCLKILTENDERKMLPEDCETKLDTVYCCTYDFVVWGDLLPFYHPKYGDRIPSAPHESRQANQVRKFSRKYDIFHD